MSKPILRAIHEAGFTEPRPIQTETIPEVLDGRDVLGLAQTGTGKTAAFALPIIEQLSSTRGRNPRALILAPTRELALQIHREIELLAKHTKIKSITVFGGVGAGPQVRALRAKPDIVVACPGRLLDLMGSGDARVDGVEVLVLDEADHMLDMGFLPDIKRIISRLPQDRQNLMFSATMPREIRSLTDHVLDRPHVVELAHSSPADTIEHALYPVDQKRKTDLLRHLIDADDFKSAIVFLRTKHRARRLARDLDNAGHRAVALQGNMSQGQRERAMQGFRDGRFDVLVATDIAARGIDVAQVSHVINYDIPNTPDAYTHRIGRTGRSERSGKAYTFVTHEDFSGIKAIERKLKMEIPRVKLQEFCEWRGDEPEESGQRPRWERQVGGRGERPERQGRAGRGARAGGRKKFGAHGGSAPKGPQSSSGGGGGFRGNRPADADTVRSNSDRRRAGEYSSSDNSAQRSSGSGQGSGQGFGAGVGGSNSHDERGGGGNTKRARRRNRTRSAGSANQGSGGQGGGGGGGGKGPRSGNHGSGRRTKSTGHGGSGRR